MSDEQQVPAVIETPVPAVIETPKKSNTIITTKYDPVTKTLTFTVPKASPTGGSMTLVLEIEKVSAANRDYAAVHGLKQRVSDAAAIPFNAKTNHYATPGEKFEAMKVIVEHLNSGAESWSPKRAERVGSDELMLTQALAEAYPDKSAEYVRNKVAGWTRAERLAMMDHPTVKPIIERLRAGQVGGVDAEKLLKDF